MGSAPVVDIPNRHSSQVAISTPERLPAGILRLRANAALKPYRIVRFVSETGEVIQSLAPDQEHIGVYIGDSPAVPGEDVLIGVTDLVDVEAGSAILQGDTLSCDSEGRAVPALGGDQEWGIALAPAAGAGAIIKVRIGARAAGGIPISSMGQPGGPAGPLTDPGGKIPADQLPFSVFNYKGDWNATTNVPVLADGVGTTGDAYIVDVAGTRDLGSGSVVWNVGDAVVYDGTVWDQIPHGGQFFVTIGGNSAAVMLVIGTTTAQPFRIVTNNLPRVTVSAIGNVGIGVDAPTVPLHVAGAIAVVAGPVQTTWDPTSGTVLAVGTSSSHNVNFIANGTTRFTLAANGDLQMAAGYTPANPRSLATKEYVDAAAATAAAGTGTTYAPTVTPGTNVASATANGNFIYARDGTSVQISGSLDVTATATGPALIQLSLPIAPGANFADTHKLSGTGAATNGTVTSPAYLRSDTGTQLAVIDWIAPNTQANTLRFTAMYTTTP